MEVRKLGGRPDGWDGMIRQYHTKTLFHESAWHEHLLDIYPGGRIDFYEVIQDGEVVGHHCALAVRKAGLPIHGSPLGGTGTNYMGPLVAKDVDQIELLKALRKTILGVTSAWHMELANPWLERPATEAAGFLRQESVTHLCEVPDTEEDAWSYLRGTARNRIRKKDKFELVVERTDDPAVVDHYWEQFLEVYGNQGLTVPFGKDRVRSLFDRLHPADRLLAVWVKHEDRVVATGLFPHDERCIYFWGGASWASDRDRYPNEPLQWEVFRYAVENGIPRYNMCGGQSQFKKKFGGEDVIFDTYYASALPFLPRLRNLYRSWHFARLKG